MTEWLHRISLKFAWDMYQDGKINADMFGNMVADALAPLEEKIEEAGDFAKAFRDTTSQEDIDALLEAFYNWCDFHRVWVDHYTL
jgi:hypothetical protein